MKVLIDHLGYERTGPKMAVIEATESASLSQYQLVQKDSGKVVYQGAVVPTGQVDRWRDWHFYSLDFSPFQEPGSYFLEIPFSMGCLTSEGFSIEDELLLKKTLPHILSYFNSQRCGGEYDRADRNIPFTGSREDRVDVHGGWYDASGDTSKYLSHLSYANYMNPQQIPLVVWCLLTAQELLAQYPGTEEITRRMKKEAVCGADFLVRLQDPAGYFYMTVFDRWTKDTSQRSICAYRGQEGLKSDDYQTGYRQGGGMAVAALARSAAGGFSGDFSSSQYREAADKGFNHLEEHNLAYLDDGKENIIDDYCALLAAEELVRATQEKRFLRAAAKRAESLCSRMMNSGPSPGWFRVDDGERPFFHASDAGLPVTALCRFIDMEADEALRRNVLSTIRRALEFELAVTKEVNNPFGYARQYVKPLQGPGCTSFFMPHENESGYWWQGENARLSSLAAAARMACGCFPDDASFRQDLSRYAADQLNWILGLNPFDTCMLHGIGRNNPEYEKDFPNAHGGICNGITAGFADEGDIDFLPQPFAEWGKHRWRWSEQWLPHAAWYLLAVCTGVFLRKETQ